MQAHAILRPARVDGCSDPDPMATLWPAGPGWPGEPAEIANRVYFIVFLIQKIIMFAYIVQRNTNKLSVLRSFESRIFTL